MRYDDIKTLERAFLSGKVSSFPDRITVGDISYNFHDERVNNVRSIYNDKFKPTVVYGPDERTPADHSIVFVWGMNKRGQIAPSAIITFPQSIQLTQTMSNSPVNPQVQPTQRAPTPKEQTTNGVIDVGGQHGTPNMAFDPSNPFAKREEEELVPYPQMGQQQPQDKQSDRVGKVKDDYDARTIGTSIDLILIGFNQNAPITGKVDTGATYCSLHGEEIRIRPDPLATEYKDQVTFVFNDRRYTVAVVDYQAIASADGGVNQRPVIQFDVKIKDELYEDVLFNLNDRSNMEDPLLIGMNLLEKGKFLIDPKMESNVDWTELDKILEQITVPDFEEPVKSGNEEIVRLFLKLLEK